MNNTNQAKGGEPIHQMIEPYQEATQHMGKQTKQNKQTTTNILNLFWTPHEGIISKRNKHMGGTKTKSKDVQTSLALGPMARLVLQSFLGGVFLL